MSDFLNKFKNIFVVEDPNAAASKPAEPTAPKTTSAHASSSQSTSSAPAAPVYVPPVTGQLNEKFVEVLTKALADNNQEGFDFFEFRSSLKSLAKMPMDDATRFQSAFAMASTMGATPQKLISSAQFYLDVLKNEEKKFGEVVAAQRSKLVGTKEQEMLNLDAAVRNKAEQIKELTKQIEEHQNRMEQLKHEIHEATAKVEATATDFTATYHSVVAQIQGDIEGMKTFLK